MLEKRANREIGEIYDKYASLVHARCRSFLGSEDEAWDATQEIFMKLMASFQKINKKSALLSWLYRSSTNHCISLLRKKRGTMFDENVHSQKGEENSQHKAFVLKEVVEKLLRPWDRKIREVVVYTYWDGYNQEEISRLTGMAQSTIRRHLTKFRRKSQALKNQGEVLHGM